ncbi:MAG: hypothetical protein OSJ73_25690, partial [Lachnospiraceae bacterium]|nr:hypothetical protein [Lachnospiraceae bacterium]
GGTNSNESFSNLYFVRYNNFQEAILQSTVGGVVKTFFVLDSIKISVSSAFSSTNKWHYESVH